MESEYKSGYYYLLQAVRYIASDGSKGKRKTAAQAALELVSNVPPPTAVEAEAVETGLDVQFDAGYKKGYADARTKIEAFVAKALQAATAAEPGTVPAESPLAGGGVWATPIAFDPVKSLTKQVKEATAPVGSSPFKTITSAILKQAKEAGPTPYIVWSAEEPATQLAQPVPPGGCDCGQCQEEAKWSAQGEIDLIEDEEDDTESPF